MLAEGLDVLVDEIGGSVKGEGAAHGRMVLLADKTLFLRFLNPHLQLFSLF
jgi:hypothetical protein